MDSAAGVASSRSASSGTDRRAWLQAPQEPRRLLRSMQSSGEALTGTMWSAVVDVISQTPGNRSLHVGSSATTSSRSFRHARELRGSDTHTPSIRSFRVATDASYRHSQRGGMRTDFEF